MSVLWARGRKGFLQKGVIMKIFLSALENGNPLNNSWLSSLDKKPGSKLKWNLVSYYYSRDKSRYPRACFIRDHSEELLVDSGAHSFQKGIKVEWGKYVDDYCTFIKNFDRSNVLGYFEMDIDAIVGYENVLTYRKKLMRVTDKIIPVWHKCRGITEYHNMCRAFSGKIVAISGFKNEDIADEQFISFLKVAKKHGCRLHCLGMTRKKILDRVPFDYVDSSSWRQPFIYARVRELDGKQKKVNSAWFRVPANRDKVEYECYRVGMAMQKEYYEKWRHLK